MDTPFLIVNPKNYLNLKENIDLALYVDQLALKYKVTLLYTAPFPYLESLKKIVSNIRIVSQHVDLVEDGTGMGKVSVASLANIGVDAVVINHAENPMILSDIIKINKQCKEFGLDTIVCCDTVLEAKAIALLNPTVILCEPTDLIGRGETSDLGYIQATNKAIREVNKDVLIEQAAGISNGADVYSMIVNGSDGTGATTSIVKAERPKEVILDMVKGLVKAKQYIQGDDRNENTNI